MTKKKMAFLRWRFFENDEKKNGVFPRMTRKKKAFFRE